MEGIVLLDVGFWPPNHTLEDHKLVIGLLFTSLTLSAPPEEVSQPKMAGYGTY